MNPQENYRVECSRLEGEVEGLHWRLRSTAIKADWEVSHTWLILHFVSFRSELKFMIL